MLVHDWTRVRAGIFQHFHFEWIGDVSRVLNRGLLPPNYYALAEQIAGELGPDVLTLHGPPGDAVLAEEPPGALHSPSLRQRSAFERGPSPTRTRPMPERS
jgi:hypothetical protein